MKELDHVILLSTVFLMNREGEKGKQMPLKTKKNSIKCFLPKKMNCWCLWSLAPIPPLKTTRLSSSSEIPGSFMQTSSYPTSFPRLMHVSWHVMMKKSPTTNEGEWKWRQEKEWGIFLSLLLFRMTIFVLMVMTKFTGQKERWTGWESEKKI